MEQISLSNLKAIVLKLASPEEILSWSHGEITKPETINYRSGKPERDGLFDERIFGPTKDWECYCGKYRRIRYKGIVCDKCGVEVTRSAVRRERMGHIALAAPVSHIWFLRGVPSRIGLILDISVNDLEKVIYFAGYIITQIDEEERKKALEEIEREFKTKTKKSGDEKEAARLKEAKEAAKDELRNLKIRHVLSEIEYHRLSRKFGTVFEASIGAEAIHKILKETNLEALKKSLEAGIPELSPLAQRKALRRLQVVNGLSNSGIRPEWMFLTVIPVIPPDLRPMVQLDGGRYATSDLNDLYRRVINRNNRLKRLYELVAPEVITRNEKRMLQEAVDALIDNSVRRGQAPAASQAQRRPLKSLADILKGKQGRFRQNLLGKRVDYSGRSVIVVGPELKLNECGLPKKMALELFKPFVIRRLIEQGIAHNIRGAGRLIEDQVPAVWEALEEAIKGRHVLLNRAPTLHRLGIQAFQPVLIEGDAIQIHPLVCSAFNADFDGDQMAVHLPLTDEAQAEAREEMLSAKNLLKPATGEPIVNPTKDIVLGCYFATTARDGRAGEGKIFADANEAIIAHQSGAVDLRAKIKVRLPSSKLEEGNGDRTAKTALVETTPGRLLFNQALPLDFPFSNHQLKSSDLDDIITKLIKRYGIEATPEILDKIKQFGFEYATKSGISWGMDDLQIPSDKPAIVAEAQKEIAAIRAQYTRGLLTDKERYDRTIEIWQGVVNRITKRVSESLDPEGPIFAMMDSKARGQLTQIRQMAGMRGLVTNPAGRIIDLPALSSYKEGLNVLEFFISTHGARKGIADTALRTAAAGYLTRRLVDVTQDVIVSIRDCKPKRGLEITVKDSEEVNKSLGRRAFGRILFEDIPDPENPKEMLIKAGTMVEHEEARIINDKKINRVVVRSPLGCRSLRGICQSCYGFDLGNNAPAQIGAAIGIVAAQAIGEPGTQLTMRTFHTGGVASGGDITTGLPRVEEIFEVRPPKGSAVIAEAAGEIMEIAEDNGEKIIKIKKDDGLLEMKAPAFTGILIEEGDRVEKGDLISEGHADISRLFKIAGRERTERYIIKEVQKIYSLQGAPIHDKHIEVVVRQMFSRVRIKDAGDTGFTPGEVVEKRELSEVNSKIVKQGKRPARAVQILMGITRVALTTTSFLSAASFQETARVLIDAAIRGRKDELRGLKENVIIGRLIPAGTGYRKQ